MLNPTIRNYLLYTSNGRLLLGNALAAVRTGLVSAADLLGFFQAAFAVALLDPATAGGAGVTASIFEAAMYRVRFPAAVDTKPAATLPCGMPLHESPRLAGQALYSVIPLRYLADIVPKSSALRTTVTLPPLGTEPKDEQALHDAWRQLTRAQRRFPLAGNLGRPIFWFTDADAARRARRLPRATAETEADSFVSLLGLGHYRSDGLANAPKWAVLLRIPGAAADAAGHHRPTFADAGTHRFFMSRSCTYISRATGPTDLWGQTANLDLLGTAAYDGARERVGWRLQPVLDDPVEIEVDLLGPVTRSRFTPNAAPEALANGVWARRRA